MRKPTFVTALAAAVALLAAGVAGAATTHHPTTLDATGTSAGKEGQFIEYGRVHSPKRHCRADRPLKMVAHYPDGSTRILDRTTSSDNGAYAMEGDFTGSDSSQIVAPRERFGKKGHRQVCDAAAISTD